MDFPTIHTNVWDAVIAIPFIIILTQLIKVFFKPHAFLVPNIAVILGLLISIFISHKGHLATGIFMGFFYGYAAIGNYASLKTSVLAFRGEKEDAP
jgi:cell shape-determining protein MreD